MHPTVEWQPPANDLIRANTKPAINEEIDDATRAALSRARTPSEIRARLAELDREWHLDRALIAWFAGVGAFTAGAAIRSAWRRHQVSGWRMLLWTQIGFLMHHAVRGWCPPVAVLRRLGFRSDKEISAERIALVEKLAEQQALLR